jgi:hypothetical protein
MMMIGMPCDMLWCVLSLCEPADIMACYSTCRSWRAMLNALPQTMWEVFYRSKVCSLLTVSASFDWKRAVAHASRASDTICVMCVWKGTAMRMAVPWTMTSGDAAHFDEYARAVVEQYLRPGIKRCLSMPYDVDFIYHDAFRLRMRTRSCIHRPSRPPCVNCETRSKRKCLRLRYDYFIRPFDNIPEEQLDELLAPHIRPPHMQPVGDVLSAR